MTAGNALMDLKREITGYGPRDAELIILLNYPNRHELQSKVPLSGSQNERVRLMLDECGIDITAVRVEYVAEYGASNVNDFYELRFSKSSGEFVRVAPNSECIRWFYDLENRLKLCSNKKVILAMGDLATNAVTNEMYASDAHSYVIPCKNGIVIPTYEPNHFAPHMFPHEDHWLKLAINKAKATLDGKQDIKHNLLIKPTFKETIDYIQDCSRRQYVAVDIETDQTTYSITTIGLARSESEAISIPFKHGDNSYWKPEEEAQILHQLAELFANEKVEKIFQNFIFDLMYLTREGLPFRGTIHDTMYLAHAINPELEKSLAALARIYCYCSPWKDNTDWRGSESLWRYNARDCARTFQIFLGQQTELKERNLNAFVDNHITPLLKCIQDACVRGLLVDKERLQEVTDMLVKEREEVIGRLQYIASTKVNYELERRSDLDVELTDTQILQAKLDGLIALNKTGSVKKGSPIHKKKDKYFTKEFRPEQFNPNSPKQVVHLLRTMGYQVPIKDGSPCTDKKHLMKMYSKYNDKILFDLIHSNNLKTLYGNYSAEKLVLDPDGRLRWSYGIAETGRLKSYPTPWDTGRNIQNFPRDKKYNFKSIIIPDAGMTMGQLDLSQAEARVVAHLANDKLMQAAIYEPCTSTGKADFHQFVADAMTANMGKLIDRQFAKLINHAANYGMGAYTFMTNCIANGIYITYPEAEEIIKSREDTFPATKEWRFNLLEQIVKTRTLTNPFGRQRLFYGRLEKLEDGSDWTPNSWGIFREGFAYIPQSTVADVINVIWSRLLTEPTKIQVLQQCHDSLLFQCKPVDKEYVSGLIDHAAEVFIPIRDEKILIPTDIKWGNNWGAV